jgi:hypothetical protein
VSSRIADVARAHGSRLDLSYLGLTAIPDSMGQLTALTELALGDNPHLPSPLQEAQAQGAEAVLAFLRTLAESSAER